MNEFNKRVIKDSPSVECAPYYKLYSIGAVGLATFCGTCLAGGLLMAINWLRLGYPKRAIITMVISVTVLFFSMLLSNLFPNIPPVAISLPVLFLFIIWMEQQQGTLIGLHIQQNGNLESKWKALGISMLFLIVIVALYVFSFYLP